MAIFNSYVSLPEGKFLDQINPWILLETRGSRSGGWPTVSCWCFVRIQKGICDGIINRIYIYISPSIILSGWWFGTWIFILPYIGNNGPNWLIFFRWVETTNQLYLGLWSVSEHGLYPHNAMNKFWQHKDMKGLNPQKHGKMKQDTNQQVHGLKPLGLLSVLQSKSKIMNLSCVCVTLSHTAQAMGWSMGPTWPLTWHDCFPPQKRRFYALKYIEIYHHPSRSFQDILPGNP